MALLLVAKALGWSKDRTVIAGAIFVVVYVAIATLVVFREPRPHDR